MKDGRFTGLGRKVGHGKITDNMKECISCIFEMHCTDSNSVYQQLQDIHSNDTCEDAIERANYMFKKFKDCRTYVSRR